MKGEEGECTNENKYGKPWVAVCLQSSQQDMTNEGGIAHVHAHMNGFPDWGCEVGQPKVMTDRRHHKKHHEANHAQEFEWKKREAADMAVAGEQADQWLQVSKIVVPGNGSIEGPRQFRSFHP